MWRLSAILLAVVLVAVAIGRFTGATSRSYIARLDVDGVIVNDHQRLKALGKVAEDSSIKAVIVRINSPGGTVVGGEALHRALLKVAKKKP